jgi:hypothetical protein
MEGATMLCSQRSEPARGVGIPGRVMRKTRIKEMPQMC